METETGLKTSPLENGWIIPIRIYEGDHDDEGHYPSQVMTSYSNIPLYKSVHTYSKKDLEADRYIHNMDGSKKYIHMETHTESYSHTNGTTEKSLNSNVPAKKYDRALTLRKIMLLRALNIENLELKESQKINLEDSDQINLPAVKTITWHAPCDGPSQEFDYDPESPSYQKRRAALRKILWACPNLELIRDFYFDTDYDLVISTGKVNCVQQLCLFSSVNSEHLLEFIKARPQLKILQLINTPIDPYPDEARRLVWVLKQLFLASADSLRVLDLSQFCSTIDLQIPCSLPKLYQLSLGSVTMRSEPDQILPRRIWLDEIFPHLRVLDCSRLQFDENSNWEHYFPSEPSEDFKGSLGSVKILVLNDTCTHFFMEKLQQIVCPKFVKLVIHSFHGEYGNSNNIIYMLAKVFRFWQHLQFLELRIDDYPQYQPNFSLDSAFTGMTEETCKRLRIFGKDASLYEAMMGMDKTEREGGRPSIGNLQKLTNLDILFGHNCLEKWAMHPDDYPRQLLTFVSARFGFSLVPAMKVSILFDQKCPWGKELLQKLEGQSLDPYVTLKHRHDPHCHANAGKGTRQGGEEHESKCVRFDNK